MQHRTLDVDKKHALAFADFGGERSGDYNYREISGLFAHDREFVLLKL
jgi:hypothetical protein